MKRLKQLVRKGVDFVKRKVVKVACGVAVGVTYVLTGGTAQAQDLSGVSIDTAAVLTLATIIIGAIAGIWAIKKVIKLGNRS